VLNLARFISVAKTRPLSWRLEHPYLIADRSEGGGGVVTPRGRLHEGGVQKGATATKAACVRGAKLIVSTVKTSEEALDTSFTYINTPLTITTLL